MEKYKAAIQKYGSNFSAQEFLIRRGISLSDFDYDFFVSLLKFRRWANIPFLVTSTIRPDDHGAHGDGQAIDLIPFYDWRIKPADPMHQWRLASAWPFLGVGIYFDWTFTAADGKSQRATGLHLDSWDAEDANRPLRWLRIRECIDGEDKSRYYYESFDSGLFYNKETGRSITLLDAVDMYKKRKNSQL